MRAGLIVAFFALALAGSAAARDAPAPITPAEPLATYLDNSGRPDAWSGGERMVPIATPAGPFNVWIKRTGNNPKMKLLLLHGGPAMGHDYMAAFDSFLPATGVEFYQYDQLGAGWSDRPDDDRLWTIARYVDEVDQVRAAIGGDASNFCLLGHSWGGILAIEYALAHPDKVKCLIISNMMASIPAYNQYADKVLKPQLDPAKLALIEKLEAEGKTDDPAYMGTLIPAWYEQHILRRPFDEWPIGAMHSFERVNQHVYTLMQGPSEMGAGGTLATWDRFAELATIGAPTLVISGKYDTMDPAYMAKMAQQLPHGELLATNGSHMDMYDDQQTYFAGLDAFLLRQAKAGH
jgi:proline iminopeptidase